MKTYLYTYVESDKKSREPKQDCGHSKAQVIYYHEYYSLLCEYIQFKSNWVDSREISKIFCNRENEMGLFRFPQWFAMLTIKLCWINPK